MTYGQIAPQDTSDIVNYRNSIQQGADFHSPIIASYGRAANDINNQTFEDQLPSNIRNRIRQGELFNLNMQRGTDLSNAAMQEAAFKSGQLGNLSAMTAPRIVQTGGNSNTTISDPWGTVTGLVGAVSTGAGAAIGA